MKENIDNKFMEIIKGLSRKYSEWEVWSDFVSISAIAIANSCDLYQFSKREEEYFQIIRKYTPDEQQNLSDLLALVVMGLEKNQEQDFLGVVYMQLNISQKSKAQYFTPYPICKMMSSLIIGGRQSSDHAPQIINDPTCGSGANLIATANEMRANHIDYQRNAYFVAQDIDLIAAKMCYIQLSLLGCPGVVIVGNSLLGMKDDMERWYTPFHFLYGKDILAAYKEKCKDNSEELNANEDENDVIDDNNEWLLKMVGFV